jgi:zinc transporter ZupT
MADPHVGTLIALAFALHNAPEAISVSIPIYVATKSALKAFVWSFFGIGLWQLIGGAIGYGLIQSVGFSQLAQGLIYPPIAGIITYIAIQGLWSAAIVYEQKNLRKALKTKTDPGMSVQWWFIVGAAVMFFSVALFGYA